MHVDDPDVDVGLACSCVCLVCHTALVAKKQGATDRQHHFAHKETTPQCDYFKVLRLNARASLKRRFQSHFAGEYALRVSWMCDGCVNTHTLALSKTKSFSENDPLLSHRPDFLLKDGEGKVIVAVHVIVNKEGASQSARDNYEASDISLLEFLARNWTDLQQLDQSSPLTAGFVSWCVQHRECYWGDSRQTRNCIRVSLECPKCCVSIFALAESFEATSPKFRVPLEKRLVEENACRLVWRYVGQHRIPKLTQCCPYCGHRIKDKELRVAYFRKVLS